MTLLRGRSQLTAIKTLVIAVGELRNYHVAPRRAASRRGATQRNVTFRRDRPPWITTDY